MSRMKLDRKPPLAKSPIRVRPPSRVLRSGPTSLQTPPGSQKPSRMWDMEEPDLRPEYRSISCELRALAKMVGKEFGDEDCEKAGGVRKSVSANSSPLFERGRFYEEYSARRNERLRKKYGGTGTGEEFKSAFKQKLGVAVESAKRGSGTRKLESMRKSVSAAYSVERTSQTPRYMLRSMSKENKKPPLAQPPALYSAQKSVIGTASRRVGY
ncbi:uncharacterized protein LOC133739762 isoform X2 [Rosa rugosa]|uniref:uncharacterized protein LOC133739762 isoform X2 n=1 Tax=Rosa rugosa TaxID=74645 RepID=UPI002B409A94|nr:uncharacterized protein LOC133739762 isoform X2 [Rosa rugosa]